MQTLTHSKITVKWSKNKGNKRKQKTYKVMVWPDGQWEGQEGLGHFGFFSKLALKTAYPSRGPRSHLWCPNRRSSQWLAMEIAQLGTPGGQQKCVVSKCTWHFSSTTQLLSELATCASGRKANEGPPKCCLWSLLTPQGREKSVPWWYKTNTLSLCTLLSLVAMWVTKVHSPAPSIMPGTG